MQPTKERRLRTISLDSVAAGTSVMAGKDESKKFEVYTFLSLTNINNKNDSQN